MDAPIYNCGNCKYFKLTDYADTSIKVGECHRYPPQRGMNVVKLQGGIVHVPDTDFPLTQPHFWCGEYRKDTTCR